MSKSIPRKATQTSHNKDYLGDLNAAYTTPAFHAGLAVGIYLALNGGKFTMRPEDQQPGA